MSHAWIFDVLHDIRTYAKKNHLNELIPYIDAACEATLGEMGPCDNVLDGNGVFLHRPSEHARTVSKTLELGHRTAANLHEQ